MAHPQGEASIADVAAAFAAQEPVEDTPTEQLQTEEAEVEAEAKAEVAEEEAAAEAEVSETEEVPDEEESAEDEHVLEDIAPSQAPISWTAEEKAEFAELPPDMQRAIARRESQRETDFHSKTTELGEQRRQFDEAVKMAQDQLVERLTGADALHTQAMEMLGYGKEPDWNQLRVDLDRDDYRDVRDRWEDQQRALKEFETKRQELAAGEQQELQQKQQAHIQREVAKTEAEWPEFANPTTRQPAVDRLFGYLHSEGVTPEQTAQMVDANFIRISRKAMAYDALQRAKPQITTKVRQARKTTKPGAAKQKAASKVESVRTAMKQARDAQGTHKEIGSLAAVFSAMRQPQE